MSDWEEYDDYRIWLGEQGTPEWHKNRSGRIGGSDVSAALGRSPWSTPQKIGMKITMAFQTKNSLMSQLGKPPEPNEAMKRGTFLESYARRAYEAAKEIKVREVGIIHPKKDLNGFPHKFVSCSPDGLVDNDGIIEIKSPMSDEKNKKLIEKVFSDFEKYQIVEIDNAKIAIVYPEEIKIQDNYIDQMQYNTGISQRKWCDYVCLIEEKINIDTKSYFNPLNRYILFIKRLPFDVEHWNKILSGLCEFRTKFIKVK